MWPRHCAEIWSDVGIVLESPCARLSRSVGGGLGALIPSQDRRLPGLAALSSVRKPIKLWREDELFLSQSGIVSVSSAAEFYVPAKENKVLANYF